jgi:hypothetical protein
MVADDIERVATRADRSSRIVRARTHAYTVESPENGTYGRSVVGTTTL